MAYETGTATGVNDLLSKLRTFAAANGWTENKWGAQGSGYWLNISKAGHYVNIVSDPSAGAGSNPGHFLRCYGATSYNSGAAYTAQPNTSGLVLVNGLGTSSLSSYHFFAYADYIHCVIEVTSGIYRHLHFGTIDKIGTWTGGAYLMGTSHDYSVLTTDLSSQHAIPWATCGSSSTGRNYVRADINGASNKWFDMYYSTTQSSRVMGAFGYFSYHLGENLLGNGVNAFNGLTPFFPALLFAGNASNLWNPLGSGPDVRICRFDNLTPGSTVTIAGVDWLVFPIYQKPAGGGLSYGYAFRKRT